MPRDISLRTRLGWGVADQALSSLTNLALGLLVARAADSDAFGAFSIVFTTYLILLGVSRALTSEVLVARYSASEERVWKEKTGRSAGACLAIGVTLGVLCTAAGATLRGEMGWELMILGAAAPGLLLQDLWRFAFFAAGRGRDAFLNDAAWAVALAALAGGLLATGKTSPPALLAVWGAGAALAALVGCLQTRLVPKPRATIAWMQAEHGMALRYLGDFGAFIGAAQLVVYVVGALAGLAAAGAFRGAQLLLGPLNVLSMGLAVVAVPEGARLAARSTAKLRRASVQLSLTLVFAAVAWTTAALLLPDGLGRELLGDTWSQAHAVVLALGIATAGSAIILGASTGLRSLGAAQRTLKARLVGAPLTVLGGTMGALYGVEAAAYGVAAGVWVSSAAWWYEYRLALAEEGPSRMRAESRPEPVSAL